MRRGSIVALLGIGVVAGGVATAVALIPTWLPKDASREAGRIDFVFWFVIAICIGDLRDRRRGDDLRGHPFPGRRRTTSRTGLRCTAIRASRSRGRRSRSFSSPRSRSSARSSSRGTTRGGANPLHINVTAQQYAWTFTYPDANERDEPGPPPPGWRSIELDMRSLDVIHAFFVPEFRTNEDIVPGLVTHLHITPTRVGTFTAHLQRALRARALADAHPGDRHDARRRSTRGCSATEEPR